MERLAEQIVDWHNRHPLARRITAEDVHTIGVVALPFVRASAQAGGFVEPVLTDAVSFDELTASPPVSRAAVWLQRLKGLVGKLPGRAPRTQWRAFSEPFLPGPSLARIERFALAHGFAEPPATPEDRPWRVIVIDERLAAAHGGWPFELYVMTAGVDVGSSRTRVLAGRGIPSEILGRRLWDPRRVGAAAGLLALVVAVAAYALWPHRAPPMAPAAPAQAASAAASAATPAASAPSQAPPPPPAEASAPAQAASLPAPAVSESATVAEAQPGIRPQLVPRADGASRPPLLAGKRPEPPTEQPAPAAQAAQPPSPAAQPAPTDPRLAGMARSPEQFVVALVGPPGSKAQAEALLKKMQDGLAGVHGNPQALQADVIQTPEGWRATVWPFASREQAQLINATLVARGLKTKAVNF